MRLPFFKKRKKEERRKIEPKEKSKIEKKEKVEVHKRKRAKKTGRAFKIVKSLHVTEKATDLGSSDQYIFKVFPKANKPEIKKAIEEIFDVDVVSVKIIKSPSKKRRLGRTFGWKKGYKKAVVKIKKGEKIDILPK